MNVSGFCQENKNKEKRKEKEKKESTLKNLDSICRKHVFGRKKIKQKNGWNPAVFVWDLETPSRG